jgi:hypothetical protein
MRDQKQTAKPARRSSVLVQLRLRPELAMDIRERATQEALPMATWIKQLVVFALDRPSRRQEARQ